MAQQKKKEGLIPKNRFTEFISQIESINYNEVLQKDKIQGFTDLIYEFEVQLLSLYQERTRNKIIQKKAELKQMAGIDNYEATKEVLSDIKRVVDEIESYQWSLQTRYSDIDSLMGRKNTPGNNLSR